MTEVGKCKSPYKYVTNTMTRKELTDKPTQGNTGAGVSAALFWSIVGFVNPAFGTAGGILTTYALSEVNSEMQNALNSSAKSQFTVKTKFRCEETYFGQRGLVHRYTYVSMKIY